MKRAVILWMGAAMSAVTCGPLLAQEQQASSELYLEEYSDEFQENFFEGLKQKGIGNHDRAIARFLKCKQLDPGVKAVDHELAKAYYMDKQYEPAQEYAILAINAAPGDYWILDQLIAIGEKLGIPLEALGDRIPYGNPKLQENLALNLFNSGKYREAEKLLEAMDPSPLQQELLRKIGDSLQQTAQVEPTDPEEGPLQREAEGTVASLRSELETLRLGSDWRNLLERSGEALQLYPLQPYFYYAHGFSLIETGQAQKAVEVLENGLDYLLDDAVLQNEFFRELARAHTLLGNTQKANEYMNKINSRI